MKPKPPHSLIFRIFVLILGLFFMFPADSIAQDEAFVPEEDSPDFFITLAAQYEQQHKTELNRLNNKDLQKIYGQRWKYISSKFSDQEIYPGKDAQMYLDGLTNEIIQANPGILSKNAFRCYFSRSGAPNASYIGQGIILFNMGLFSKLSNESEAAFIISHEIAHYLLKHTENAINDYVKVINSEAIQEKLRQIKSSRYGKRHQIEQLSNTLTFDSRRHSRLHENDADSLAVELMRNTRFDLNGALSTLRILDEVDGDTLEVSAILARFFNANEYPFKSRWLSKESGLLGGHANIQHDAVMTDSLKTHPDCVARIEMIQKLINQSERRHPVPYDSTNFRKFRKLSSYEVIDYSFKSNYTKSLYFTLELLEKNPGDPFLITQVGRIFNGIYVARKTHTEGKMTDLPAPFYSRGYNTLLQFIQNLYMEEISAVGYHYLKSYATTLGNYPLFSKTLIKSSEIVKQ